MEIRYEIPAAEEYLSLRGEAGLSVFSLEAAKKGLANSLFAVTLREAEQLIGMGRVSGDGGCFFLVTDIAVKPSEQGKGYGKLIMGEIMKFLEREVPSGSFANLFADVPANRLYEQFGFRLTSPVSEGMYWRKP
ncbi:GNAT family N-acetyltransferase [Paenibacillus massiliensis]|uniref:GNAT family N-acetyltransferase n=1 Tax=Paenibacillus massiliensis TaxID=225917 RepID=UPI000408B433|nr:GNAT family N-acetyltransferase [Paenibacillus massiliensis]